MRSRALVVYLVYGVIVVAIAVARLHLSEQDDTSLVETLAQLCIGVVASAAPAWLIESLLRRRLPSLHLSREQGNTRRELRETERTQLRARRFREQLSRDQVAWDEEAARLRSQYTVEWERERARLRGNSRTDDTAESNEGDSPQDGTDPSGRKGT